MTASFGAGGAATRRDPSVVASPVGTRPSGRAACRYATIVAAVGLLLVVAAPASFAHSFLATTRPVQGERLAAPPRAVSLQLSEPVVRDTVQVEVVDGLGQPLDAGTVAVDNGGRVVRLPLVDPGSGVYRVSWHVVSAVDGHESAGELAFAVGDAAAISGDAAAGSARGVSWLASVGTWLLLGGWSVALGAGVLAVGCRGRVRFPGRPRTWVRSGAVVALAGLGLRVAVAGAPGRVEVVASVTAVALLAAVSLSAARKPWPPLAALGVVAVAWPGRGHGAAQGTLGWVLDSVHLTAAGVWAGGLAAVLAALSVAARRGTTADALPLVWRYAKLALVAVVVLVTTGVAGALLLVPSLDALLTGTYGRLLLVKAALLVLALGAAAVARWRLLPRQRAVGLRRLTRPELAALTLAVAVAAVLVDVAPPRPAAAEMLLGPPPIDGAVARVAGMAGQLTVDLQAGDGRVDVNVRGPSGGIDSDLELRAVLPDGTRVELHPRPCGDGCFTQRLDLPDATTTITASVSAEGWQGGSAQLPVSWPPPPSRPQRFERMRRAMLATDAVVLSEAVGHDPGSAAGGMTLEGEQFVALMPWAGGGVTDVRPVAGRSDRFTFYLPGSHMWFDVTVDDRGRLVSQRLVNPGHDIRYRFAYPSDGRSAPATSSASRWPPDRPLAGAGVATRDKTRRR